MASDDTFKLVAFMAFSGFALVGKGISDFRKKRRVADVACSKAATAAQGLTELEGFAWHGGTIYKNLSQTDSCVRFIELQQYVRRNKSSYWDTIWTHTEGEFYLVDKTGAVKVILPNKDFNGVTITKNWGSVPSFYQSDVLSFMGSKSTGFGFPPTGWFGGSFRIRETSIPVGCPVYCQGNFVTPNENPKTVTSEGINHFFEMIQKNAKQPVHANLSFDSNRDGIVSEDEANSAFMAAGQVALRKSVEAEKNSNVPLCGVVMSSNEHPMILATRHQHYLLQSMGKWCLLEIIGGAALVAASAFVLLAKYGDGNY